MAEYSLTAAALLSFGDNPPQRARSFARWAAFADKVGQALLPFVISPDRLDEVPFGALGMKPVKLSALIPQTGEMWILFCFRDSFRDAVSPTSPLRKDGFPLILEWRRGQEDSELLSNAFHELAGCVRQQFGEKGIGWGLHPAFDRYGDTIAFTDPVLFSDAENSLQIASAWGSLALGLHCRIANKSLVVWPFPSIQWDREHNKVVGVAGIAEKLSVAADCGATVVTVAREQKREVEALLEKLRKMDEGARYGALSVLATRDVGGPEAIARKIDEDLSRRSLVFRLMTSALACLFALMACGCFFLYDMIRPVSLYYADYVDSFGLPKGIFPLSKSEVAHRHMHYRFEYKGFQHGVSPHADSAGRCIWRLLGLRRRLVRVVQANSRGNPKKWDHVEYAERPLIQEFGYDGKSPRLCEIRHVGDHGLEKRIELSVAEGIINGLMEFYAGVDRLDIAYSTASFAAAYDTDLLLVPKSEIAIHKIIRDANGRVSRRLFLNRSLANVADKEGICGLEYEYDTVGRQTAQWYLFRNGDGYERGVNKNGVAGKRYEYVGRNMHKMKYVGMDFRLVVGPHGWMVCVDDFDTFGNNVESRFYGESEKAVSCVDGYAGCQVTYDEHGNTVRLVFFDADRRPTPCKNGYAEIRRCYDEQGNIIEESYFNNEGKPVLSDEGFAVGRSEYNERGNVVKESYFDENGSLTLCKLGISGYDAEYDEHGNRIRESYFGIDRRSKASVQGFAMMRCSYDEYGHRTSESYFDVDGNRAVCEKGYAASFAKYDRRGNLVEESYLGIDGKLVECKHGFAVGCAEYDDHGNIVKESYFDIDRKRTLNEFGISGYDAKYDALGNMTNKTFLGIDDKPKVSAQGIAEIRYAYDGRNGTRKLSFFDANSIAMSSREGYLIVAQEILSDGGALSVGLCDGDILCKLGDCDILNTENVGEMFAAAQTLQECGGELWVACKADGTYKIKAFNYPGGLLGIKIKVKRVANPNLLLSAYRAYCER